MTRRRGFRVALALAVVAAGAGVASVVLSSSPSAPAPVPALDGYRSCADALAGLRRATESSVTPYGLPDTGSLGFPANGIPASAADAGPSGLAAAVAREADVVKTDGKRIVAVSGGVLTVVDAVSRRVTGALRLASAGSTYAAQQLYQSAQLLLDAGHALVLATGGGTVTGAPGQGGGTMTRLLLIDVSASPPAVMSSYSISGQLVDARLIGSVARVVTRTAPGVVFPELTTNTTAARALAAERAAIAATPISAWLPAYATSAVGGGVTTGTIPCTSVSHPAAYSGPGLLTVGTFDMSASSLGTGTPVAIVGDGDTVYATASSLYIASGIRRASNPDAATPVPAPTSVYRFDISGPGESRYAASATVPGYLVNQDAMSEWNGYLRVATTTGLPEAYGGFTARPGPGPGSPVPHSVSAVYELSLAGPAMHVAGQVTGLGPGDWIASVLFTGPTGYVATSGKTDKLYTLDLSQPTDPRQAGHLALTGYPEHLYPVSATRLIGVGRATGTAGGDLGLQVSAFSVASLAAQAQLARDTMPGSSADAEFDPRGFLYWPSGGLVVLPGSAGNGTGTLVLRLSGGQLARAGLVQQPVAPYTNINRSLVTGGDTLWTASWAGLLAVSPATLRREAWIPLSR